MQDTGPLKTGPSKAERARRSETGERVETDAVGPVDQMAKILATQTRVLELIATGKPFADVLEALVGAVEAQCEGAVGSVLLLDEDGKHLRHGSAPRLPDDYNSAVDAMRIGPCAGSCGTAAYRGERVVVEDVASDPLWVDYRDLAAEHGLRAMISGET